jgi:hypothetical protein
MRTKKSNEALMSSGIFSQYFELQVDVNSNQRKEKETFFERSTKINFEISSDSIHLHFLKLEESSRKQEKKRRKWLSGDSGI